MGCVRTFNYVFGQMSGHNRPWETLLRTILSVQYSSDIIKKRLPVGKVYTLTFI